MKRHLFVTGFLLVASGCGSAVAAAEPGPGESQEGRLEIRVEGLRGGEGNVVLAVYDNKAAFNENGVPLAWVSVPANSQRISVAGFPPGKVAIAAFHDTNRNGEYDMKGGIPLEGWGYSGVISSWSEPNFDAAITDIGNVTIQMHYYN